MSSAIHSFIRNIVIVCGTLLSLVYRGVASAGCWGGGGGGGGVVLRKWPGRRDDVLCSYLETTMIRHARQVSVKLAGRGDGVLPHATC